MPEYTVPAVERAFRIIELLERSSLGATKSEIASRLSLPYSSVFHLLNTLEQFRYAWRDASSGRYYLGPRLAAAGRFQGDFGALRETAAPHMRNLIRGTFYTSHLAVLRDGEAVYIEKQEPKGFFKLNTWVGQRVYVHTSAVGKVLIAQLSRGEVQEIWRHGLPRRTSRSIKSFQNLWAELCRTRNRGYAVDDEEDQIGGRCVAAPVFSPAGAVVAALGVSAMAAHLPVEDIPALADRVAAAAAEITAAIGAPLRAVQL